MKTAETEAISFPGIITVEVSRIQSLLCCAFEGGSNYWLTKASVVMPPGHTADDYKVGGRFNIDDLFDCPVYNAWRFQGGKIRIFVDFEDGEPLKEYSFTLESAVNGLRLMKEGAKCRSDYWMEFERENEDADVADCWLQLAIFGEVVFG